jgi:hypothetical protein
MLLGLGVGIFVKMGSTQKFGVNHAQNSHGKTWQIWPQNDEKIQFGFTERH